MGINFDRNHGWSEEEVLQIMLSLQSRGIIKAMEFNSFTRIHHEETEIKVIIHCPIGLEIIDNDYKNGFSHRSSSKCQPLHRTSNQPLPSLQHNVNILFISLKKLKKKNSERNFFHKTIFFKRLYSRFSVDK